MLVIGSTFCAEEVAVAGKVAAAAAMLLHRLPWALRF
jgi:hypothetical protein